MPNGKKNLRMDGIAFIAKSEKDHLVMIDGQYKKKLKLTLSIQEIGYLGQELNNMLNKNQQAILEARKRMGQPV